MAGAILIRLKEVILISPGIVRVVRKGRVAKMTPFGAEKLGYKKEAILARRMKGGEDG